MIICSSGKGMCPEDIGKVVIILEDRPQGDIENDYHSYDTYWKPFKDTEYETGFPESKYYKSDYRMFRKPTEEEIIQFNLNAEPEESLLTVIL